MTDRIMPTVRISFDGSVNAESPFVVIYNPSELPRPLASQVLRFGLMGRAKQPYLSGQLKGTQAALTELIQSYGVRVQVVASAI